MVAIVSGNSLGLNLTSAAQLGDAGVLGNAALGQAREAAYLNVANGNLVLQDQDGLLQGRGDSDIANLRTYNSQGQYGGGAWQVGGYKTLADTFSERRNKVAISSSEGKVENSTGRAT
jgi:hypothetical protein